MFDKLKKESKGFSQDSVALEQQTARILKEQESHGFLFDDRKAEILLADLRERMGNIEKLVHEVFKPKLVDIKEVIPKLKQDGTLSKQGLTDEEYDERLYTDDITPFTRRKIQEFNLGSRKQIG